MTLSLFLQMDGAVSLDVTTWNGLFQCQRARLMLSMESILVLPSARILRLHMLRSSRQSVTVMLAWVLIYIIIIIISTQLTPWSPVVSSSNVSTLRYFGCYALTSSLCLYPFPPVICS